MSEDRYTEAEELLVGRLLLGGSEFYRVADLVTQAQFADADLALVFGAVAALCEEGLPVNRLGLQARLGADYLRLKARLAGLYTQSQVAGNTEHLAEVVAEGHTRRQALRLAEQLATAAYNDETDITAVTAAVAGALLGEVKSKKQEGVSQVAERLDAQLSAWSAEPLEPGRVRGLASGLRNVDALTGGLLTGYHILAGRAGMGKTALALQVAANIAETGKPVLYLTFEISPDLLLLRMASARCGVPVIDGYTRNLKPDDAAKLRQAVREISAWSLEFYAGSPQLTQVVAALHRSARTLKPALVIIDNLGHLVASERQLREYDELNLVSRTIKGVANALGLPIMALHQLSRGVESREDKRPGLADLRGSGHLEQDADSVWLLYRPGYYNAGAGTEFSVEVAKNRLTGRVGATLLFFTACAGLRDAVLPQSGGNRGA